MTHEELGRKWAAQQTPPRVPTKSDGYWSWRMGDSLETRLPSPVTILLLGTVYDSEAIAYSNLGAAIERGQKLFEVKE